MEKKIKGPPKIKDLPETIYYGLKDRKPVPMANSIDWAKWLLDTDRIVAREDLKTKSGEEIMISTVFLGVDYNFGRKPPLLFETLVFGGELEGEMVRYATWEEAEEGHKIMTKRVQLTL
jgi:hypothetical protein